MTKRYNKKTVVTAADVLREKNTAAMYLRIGDPRKAAEHTAEAQRLEAELNASARPAPQPVQKKPLKLEMFLLVNGFMDGHMVVQRLPVRPETILALQHDIGLDAYAAESGTVLRDLIALRRPLTEKEKDMIEVGLKAAVDEALIEDEVDDKPKLRLVEGGAEEVVQPAAVAE